MMKAPICFERYCKHYTGVSQPDGTEMTERYVCEAFPEGIPEEILDGSNDHSEPLTGQGNNIVFEKTEE